MERAQNIRHATREKLAANFTLSGQVIEGGLNIVGSPRLCSACGFEQAPYVDGACPSCQNF